MRHLGEELADRLGSLSRDEIIQRLAIPELLPVLRAVGDPDQVLQRAATLATEHRPTVAGTARSAAQELTIFLLQQVDIAWWRDATPFDTALALTEGERTDELIDVSAHRVECRFRFQVASGRLRHRVRNKVVREVLRGRGPGHPGLSFPYAHRGLVALLNQVAAEFSRRSGGEPLWVNSLTRTVEHQKHLQQLGFTAHLPSAHCRGWAADVETNWHERRGTREVLVDVLRGLVTDGVMNGIDEGRIWHLCPNPDWVRTQEVSS